MIYEAPFIADGAMMAAADGLRLRFGGGAGLEAASRAAISRDRGNIHHFCRWREVERLLDMLDVAEATGTLH